MTKIINEGDSPGQFVSVKVQNARNRGGVAKGSTSRRSSSKISQMRSIVLNRRNLSSMQRVNVLLRERGLGRTTVSTDRFVIRDG